MPEFLDSALAACVDIGGSKALIGFVDQSGNIRAQERWTSPPGSQPDELVAGLGLRMRALARSSNLDWRKVVGVGYSTAGMMDVEKGIIFASPNQGSWRNVPFKELLQREFQLPAWIEMDANAAALGEGWLGAGQDADPLIFLVIGTGIGSGILVNGRVLRGWNGTAGEVGHTVIDPSGPVCNCGNRGCLESLASGPAIARRAYLAYQDAQGNRPPEPAAREDITAEHVFQAARAGEETALAVVQETVEFLSIGVTNLIHLLNPKAIVLGGGVGLGGADLLLQPLIEAVARRVGAWVDFKGTLIATSKLGNNAGLLGAAWLVWNYSLKDKTA
jgi:glucokinase